MQPKVMSHPPVPNFHAVHWQQRKAWQTHWHALDTAFGRGDAFLQTLQAWQQDANAPHTLFFTAFAAEPPKHIHPLIATSCFGLLPGVHRIVFAQGKVQLTLCIGPTPAMAREIDMAADSICIDSLDLWHTKALVRFSKVQTVLQWRDASPQALVDLKLAGMLVNTRNATAQYKPLWTPRSALRASMSSPKTAKRPSQHAVIIGAGLSGAAVAHSLAIRGWTVEVLDQADHMGAGASGLPAGIFATHVSPDNSILSRITRDGVRATIHRANQLLKHGTHWQLSNLLEHRYAGKRQLPKGDAWPAAGHEWSTEASHEQRTAGGLRQDTAAMWHPLAGWIQTPVFVKSQLSHPNITWRGACQVAKLQRVNSIWQVLDPHGKALAQTKCLVLANAHQCQSLIDTVEGTDTADGVQRPRLPATALRGQVTWGSMALLPASLKNKLPVFPMNGHGSYIGNLKALTDCTSDTHWLVGSSFQRNDLDLRTRQEDQKSNIQQWAELMPALQAEIQHSVDPASTHAWAGIRCALPDRVPAVGEFAHPDFESLHVCTGMGARGISLSVLCGEVLAAHLNHEPLPMALSLAKLMSASRFG